MTMILATLLLLQQAPVEARERPQVTLSGGLDLHFAYREDRLNEAALTLNTGLLPPDGESDDFWAGRITLRADVALKDMVSAVIELQTRDFDGGANLPFGRPAEDADTIYLEQGYIDVEDFLTPRLGLRMGVQEVTWRNRPHDEPFFLDLGESEAFNAGRGTQVRNTVDRDVREAAGIRVRYVLAEVLSAQALAMVYNEAGSASSDESVYALVLNGKLSDTLALWLMSALVAGDNDDQQIMTFGLGADGYVGGGKRLELFGEAYLQKGRLTDEIRKSAYAFNAGARVVGIGDEKLWAEAAGSIRSGNLHSGDDRDEAFQSYENENRFLIMQSAEFGLDVDTNVRMGRGALGYGPFEVGGRPLRFRLDAGTFRADAALRTPTGDRLTARRRWGLEIDPSVTLNYNESLTFWIQGAWLTRSALLEKLHQDHHDEARIAAVGADLRF